MWQRQPGPPLSGKTGFELDAHASDETRERRRRGSAMTYPVMTLTRAVPATTINDPSIVPRLALNPRSTPKVCSPPIIFLNRLSLLVTFAAPLASISATVADSSEKTTRYPDASSPEPSRVAFAGAETPDASVAITIATESLITIFSPLRASTRTVPEAVESL